MYFTICFCVVVICAALVEIASKDSEKDDTN